jgi:hypothetical protein
MDCTPMEAKTDPMRPWVPTIGILGGRCANARNIVIQLCVGGGRYTSQSGAEPYASAVLNRTSGARLLVLVFRVL